MRGNGHEQLRKPQHNSDPSLDGTLPSDVVRLEEELADLSDRHGKLNAMLRDAALRQRFGADPEHRESERR